MSVSDRLKNLASAYEGSNAMLSLSFADAKVLIDIAESVGEAVDSLYCDPAKVTGKKLCELVNRMGETPAPKVEDPLPVVAVPELPKPVIVVEPLPPPPPPPKSVVVLPPPPNIAPRHHRKK